MNVTVTKLPGSRVETSGEIPAADFDAAVKKATQKFVANAELDGFRRGKAPEKLVVEKIGEDKILHEAAEAALQAEWPKILEENKIEAIGPAEFHILKIARGNNLVWKAAVAVLPEITLPDYRNIAKALNAKKVVPIIEVTDKEVDDTLAYIQRARTPEEQVPPPLDDAYARSVGNFPTLTALKENIRAGIEAEKKIKAEEEHRGKILADIAATATLEIPDVLIELEKQKMLSEIRARVEETGLGWNDYLAHTKTTEEDLKKNWQDDAVKRVRTGLALHEIASREHIEPREPEIAERMSHILRPYGPEEQNNLDQKRVRDYAVSTLRNEKVLTFLENQK